MFDATQLCSHEQISFLASFFSFYHTYTDCTWSLTLRAFNSSLAACKSYEACWFACILAMDFSFNNFCLRSSCSNAISRSFFFRVYSCIYDNIMTKRIEFITKKKNYYSLGHWWIMTFLFICNLCTYRYCRWDYLARTKKGGLSVHPISVLFWKIIIFIFFGVRGDFFFSRCIIDYVQYLKSPPMTIINSSDGHSTNPNNSESDQIWI